MSRGFLYLKLHITSKLGLTHFAYSSGVFISSQTDKLISIGTHIINTLRRDQFFRNI
ncbi:hypothetical protein SAMN05421820_11580 [Pedobacter steynii]|uniref:Uncharacterized protein n=1 Tax=Pedobacter steynii TaxID=430522 RepID=A0A1H0JU92_9SPHI|nr:hypothetical protein SAMN05421820_11580 [Pedobacter steynii]